jgi:peptide/nickel transport system permease protein
MVKFLALRIAAMVGTLLVASFVVYGAIYLAPGTPLSFLLGGSHGAPPAVIAAIKAQYHLNDSFLTAYWSWLVGLLHGHFGESFVQHESVTSLLKPRITTSLFLVTYAAILILVFGIGSGVAAALRPRRLGPVIVTLTTVAMAIPPFVSAVVLVLLFSVDLAWFPALGNGSGFFGQLYHMTLPAVALALASVAYISRITSAAVMDEMSREHVETARARGIRERRVIRRHVLRNAWIPISTVATVTVAALIAGDAVIEVAFGLNGVGAYLVQSVEDKDYPVVQITVLLLVTIFIVVNMLVDIGYTLADPRVRLGGRGR